jgi:exosortase
LLALGGLLAWVYWPTLGLLAEVWRADPQYSHGFLVPAFAAYLLWARRDRAGFAGWRTSWWGVGWIAAAGLLHLAGAYLAFDWLDAMALLPCLAGLAVLLGGRPALAWSWPAIGFLAFMVPLPYRVAHSLSGPLQRIATDLSGYTMQMLGLPALVEGNTILLNGTRLAVVEACSGLSMLIVFAALSTAAAVVVRRPLLDRIILLCSAIPIAILANVVRITATGVAVCLAGPRLADVLYHDLAGWLMMPLAIGMLALVLKVLDFLLVVARDRRPPVRVPGVPAAAEKTSGSRLDGPVTRRSKAAPPRTAR